MLLGAGMGEQLRRPICHFFYLLAGVTGVRNVCKLDADCCFEWVWRSDTHTLIRKVDLALDVGRRERDGFGVYLVRRSCAHTLSVHLDGFYMSRIPLSCFDVCCISS